MEEEIEQECDVGDERRRAWTWQTCRRLQMQSTGVGNVRSECRMQPRARMGTIEKQGDDGGRMRAHRGHEQDAEQTKGA